MIKNSADLEYVGDRDTVPGVGECDGDKGVIMTSRKCQGGQSTSPMVVDAKVRASAWREDLGSTWRGGEEVRRAFSGRRVADSHGGGVGHGAGGGTLGGRGQVAGDDDPGQGRRPNVGRW